MPTVRPQPAVATWGRLDQRTVGTHPRLATNVERVPPAASAVAAPVHYTVFIKDRRRGSLSDSRTVPVPVAPIIILLIDLPPGGTATQAFRPSVKTGFDRHSFVAEAKQ